MTDIKDILNRFKKLNVLIVGDVMIDRYMYGKVNRISPEAPVPVVELQKQEDRLGGAANVALNIKALGATPYLFSFIGADTEGVVFQQLMTDLNLPIEGILKDAERKTTVKTRIMAGTHQMLRIDHEITTELNEQTENIFIKKIQNLLNKHTIHVVIFQDYNKGVLTHKTIKAIMSEAAKRQIPTVVDPKKKHFLDYEYATIFKPNLKEIRDVVPFEINTEINSLEKAANYLHTHLKHQYTMITLSEKGIFWKRESSNERGQIYGTKPRNITDVSGAGDTVVSIAALGLASDLEKDLIVTLSNLAGGQVCETAGVVPVNSELLAKEFTHLFV